MNENGRQKTKISSGHLASIHPSWRVRWPDPILNILPSVFIQFLFNFYLGSFNHYSSSIQFPFNFNSISIQSLFKFNSFLIQFPLYNQVPFTSHSISTLLPIKPHSISTLLPFNPYSSSIHIQFPLHYHSISIRFPFNLMVRIDQSNELIHYRWIFWFARGPDFIF